MRSAASWPQPLQESFDPWGARTGLGPETGRAVAVMGAIVGLVVAERVGPLRLVGEAEQVLLAWSLGKRQRPLLAIVDRPGTRQQVTPANLLSGARKLPAVCGEPLVPSCQHEAGGAVDGCGSGRRQPGIGNSLGVGLDGDDPASVQLVADGRDECAGDLVAVWSGNDLEAGDDPR